MKLSTNLGKLKLKNPLVLASGILGVNSDIILRVAEQNIGALTCKSISLYERKGHENPCCIKLEDGLLNAMGLSCKNLNKSLSELKIVLKNTKVPLIVSVFGESVEEFGLITREVSKIKPNAIELNISCPNVNKIPFSTDKDLSFSVVKESRKNTKLPLIVKLSPNVTDIVEIAKSVEKAGANIINAINTVAGMKINVDTGKAILTNKKGGISGKAIKPVAVKAVYDIYENVKMPIIGTGGVLNGRDALELIMAGASAVSVGSAIYYKDVDVFNEITKEIEEFMLENNYNSIKEMLGVAHGNI